MELVAQSEIMAACVTFYCDPRHWDRPWKLHTFVDAKNSFGTDLCSGVMTNGSLIHFSLNPMGRVEPNYKTSQGQPYLAE